MRTIVIGDLHGCLDELHDLLAKVGPVEGDRLVHVGDLLDRGPWQAETVRFLREQRVEGVLGNHDEKHIRWWKHPASKKNGVPLSVAANNALTEEVVAYLEQLPTCLDLGSGFLAVHAGLEPGFSMGQQRASMLRWVRYVDWRGRAVSLGDDFSQPPGTVFWTEMYEGPFSVVYGHCVHSLFDVRTDRKEDGIECWGIDTGCVFGGRLSAFVVETREVVQVQARRAYVPPHMPVDGE